MSGSALEDDAVGDGVPREDLAFAGAGNMKKVLDKKINKSEMNDYLKNKASIKDIEVVMRQIQILHKQLKQLVSWLIQKIFC